MTIDIKVLATGSSGNAYLIKDGKSSLLLDCGISFSEIQKRSDYARIDTIFVSHSHGDHSKGVKEALRKGYTVYMPAEMAAKYENHNTFGIHGGMTIMTKDIKAVAFELVHDVQCLGYLIDMEKARICYITDTTYTKYTFPGVTHWMIECNHSRDILDEKVASGELAQSLRNRIVQSHMNLETVKGILAANDLSKTEEIWLLHLSNSNSDEEHFKREIQALTGKIVHVA